MLETRVRCTAFVAHQSYQSGEKILQLAWNYKFTSLLGEIQQAGELERAGKSVTSCFALVSDYKRLDTRSYFIITNFHTELKPQENVSHDMNPPTFTLYTLSPVATWGFGGLSPPKLKYSMKHYKLVEFLSNLNVNPPVRGRKPLLTTFWRRFCIHTHKCQTVRGRRGFGSSLHFDIWHFPIIFLAKRLFT